MQSEVFGHLAAESSAGGRTPYDTGHVFDTVKYSIESPFWWSGEVKRGQDVYRYDGPLLAPLSTQSGKSGYQSVANVDSGYYGTRAIARTIPTNPLVGFAVDLAEFKSEGVKAVGSSLLMKKHLDTKVGAEEYLNWQFGLNPLIHDMRSGLENLLNARNLIHQFEKNSGKLVRRRYTFPVETTVELRKLPASGSNTAVIVGSIPSWIYGGEQMSQVVRTTGRIWFSGAYTYALPIPSNQLERVNRYAEYANYLLGTDMSADVLWNILPWSWLSDWHWNIGDIMANATALSQEGLVIQYGYLMIETDIRHEVLLSRCRVRDSVTPLVVRDLGPVATTWRTLRKQRIQADPFGFGSNPSGYSARKWSILGALGLTKAPGILRRDIPFL